MSQRLQQLDQGTSSKFKERAHSVKVVWVAILSYIANVKTCKASGGQGWIAGSAFQEFPKRATSPAVFIKDFLIRAGQCFFCTEPHGLGCLFEGPSDCADKVSVSA